MKYLRSYTLFVSLLLFSSSCSYMLYSPNPEVVEPVSEKGQLQTSLSIGYSTTQKYGLGLNYGLTKNIAITASGAIGPKQKHVTSAIGYYRNLSPKSFMDFYAGFNYGKGYGENYEYTSSTGGYTQITTSTYVKPFITAGFHTVNRKIQYDFTLSFGRMDFTKFDIETEVNNETYINKVIAITPLTIIQPGIRIAYLDDLGKLYFGLIINPTDYYDYDLHGYNIYVGGSTDLSKWLKTKK